MSARCAAWGGYVITDWIQRLRYAPFLAQLVVTRRCNLDCGYCSEFDKVSLPVPLETLKERIDDLKRLGTFAVELTGGEPMLHPQIYDAIRYCREQRFVKVMMISNAYLFNADRVRQLNDAGLQELQISIDGVEPNHVTVKVLKPLRRKLEDVARQAKFRVVLNSVIGSAPPQEVLEVIDFAQQHGFSPRVLLIHDDKGQLKLGPDELALIAEIRKRLGRRFMEGGDYRLRLINEGTAPFKCRSGSRYLYVDEFGVVRWCSQTREVFGVSLAEYTAIHLRQQFHTPKSCNAHCTIGCVRNCSRLDQWRQ